MSKYDDLVAKLREIFQIDRPELDFGIYRILHARADEINAYLATRLKERVAEALAEGTAANTGQLQRDLDEAVKAATALGMSPDDAPKVKELRAALAASSAGASEHENAVFSHLLTFFSRYYDKGDFISQRRYKGDTYAIPYAGEEVVLHWANRDQYYTKSGEEFSNYSFKLDDGRRVHFRLVAADTAKDNRKDNDKERRFALAEARTVSETDEDGESYEDAIAPVSEEDGELIVRFEYRAMPKGTKQESLVDAAVEAVLADEAVKARWLALTARVPTDKKPQRTLLEKHLTTYTQKNTADYFIHKDLGGFLGRELDFYIKNEVMNLDDVQNAEGFGAIEKQLRMVQCLRAIALDLIAFLASVEGFQKKLWLKKKFVVSAHYCMTLDRVPEALYPAIVANPAQWEDWHSIGLRDDPSSGDVDELKAHPYRMVDTALFDDAFRCELLKGISDLDGRGDGLVVHGDNFHALTLLRERYRGGIRFAFNDPPYNTKSRDFAYKDAYRHSSWLTMMHDRTMLCRSLLSRDGVLFHYVDENEKENASLLLTSIFGNANRFADIVWKNSSKNGEDYVSVQHEYILTAVNDSSVNLGRWKERKEGLEQIYKAFEGFRKERGTDWEAIHRDALKFYNSLPDSNPIRDSKHYSWMDERGIYFPDNISKPAKGYYYDLPHPVTGQPCKKPAGGWRFVEETMLEKVRNNEIHFGKDHTTVPNNKTYLRNTEDQSLTSIKYKDGRVASNLLRSMFGYEPFKNPKDVDLTVRIIKAVEAANATVLDCFGGSGTTAHAAIALAREGHATRYVLADQGDHVRTVMIPRLKKAVYSADWREGRPTGAATGISHAFKVIRIESYEDTLNNLVLKRTESQGALLDRMGPEAHDDYMMRYMLDVESRGSLLSVDDFRKPFDYRLNIAVDSAGAFEPSAVDLIETFNYLIGLAVRHVDIQVKQGFATVEGTLPTGEKTLVLWRDADVLDYEGLAKLCDKLAINPADSEYDVVYINGDHNVPSVLTTSEDEGELTKTLRLRQIEPEFLERMFGAADA